MRAAFLRTGAFTVIAAAIALSAACKSPCRQLTEKQCECTTGSVEKEQCIQNAQQLEDSAEGRGDLDQEAQDRCETYLETCDCNDIETAEGKRNCGLAR